MRTLLIWVLQYFQSFRNCCLFCTFWLVRNFYSGEPHHANYSKHSLNDHFQHCAHCVFDIYSICKVFEMVFVLHILAYSKLEPRSFSPCELWWTLFKSSFQTLRTVCIWDLQCFETFRNCCFFCTFWHIRNFYSGEAHHANYSKHSLNHHFQHCAQCVYETYRVFKVFQIAISFAHFFLLRNFYSGDAPHANYGKHCLTHHFQHCANCIYEIYSIFKVFEIAVYFAHIGLFEISTPVMSNMLNMANIV